MPHVVQPGAAERRIADRDGPSDRQRSVRPRVLSLKECERAGGEPRSLGATSPFTPYGHSTQETGRLARQGPTDLAKLSPDALELSPATRKVMWLASVQVTRPTIGGVLSGTRVRMPPP